MSIVLNEESFRRARCTQVLLLLNILVYIIVNVILGLLYGDTYILLLAQDNAAILIRGEVWRLLTAIFMHAGLYHLFSNMIALFFFGVAAEQYFTRRQFLLIYFVSGLMGSLFTLIIMPIDTISLGASGAIFGLIGAVFLVVIKTDQRFALYALIYIAIFIQNSFAPGIGTWAHLFGLLSGILLAYLFKKEYIREQWRRQQRRQQRQSMGSYSYYYKE
jgi:rhomboid protease GluP